jgi:pimeloyl-ACP methyl ester carboxylesterase
MIAQKYWQKTFVVFIVAAFALAGAGDGFERNMRPARFAQEEHPFGSAYSILSLLFQFPQATPHQFKSDGITPIPEGGTITAGAVTLGVSLSSATLTPLRLQVELRPLAASFTGVPTAASGILLFTKTGTVAVSGLAGGSYHWRARLTNALTGATSAWQNFGAMGNVVASTGASDFAVILREPIVIVPGIAGTILQKSDGTEAWPNINEMLVSPSDSYLDALALDATGNAPASSGANDVQGSTLRAAAILKTAQLTLGGITLFSDDFYGNLINAFTSAGYIEGQNLFTAPYDWRMDINNSVASLAAVIAQARAASPTGKINIVAHSMGGLLVKKYLAGLATASSAPSASFLDKVVLAGVPELGAPYALKMLNYGDDLGIPIANQDEMKKIAQNMLAIYELLPSEKYESVVGSYVQDFRSGADTLLDFAATAQLMTTNTGNPDDVRNPMLVALGDAFHRSIDTAPVAAPSVYTILGCGKPTITGYDLYDNGVVDLERGSGDGTVPEVSAMDLANAAHNYFVMSGATGIDHTGLTSDARPVALIAGIVAGSIGSAGGSGAGGNNTAPLPQGISSSLADCATQTVSQSGASQGAAPQSVASSAGETTIEFSAHGTATSTIDLGVYDAIGNYTGVTASGTVATGIPGSEYEKLGNNIFVLVPAGKNYKVIDQMADHQAIASGTFEMKVRGYRAGATDREATYLSVPLAGTSIFAELDFAGFNGNMDLRMGHRNNAQRGGSASSTFDSSRHPDSIISGPFTRDHQRKEWQK